MDYPVATIVSINNGLATVSVERSAVCARCASGKGCGAGLLSGKRKPARIEVPVPDAMHLLVGDRVKLTLAPADLLRASFLVYGLPLVGVVTALSFGWLASSGPLGDAKAIGLAIVGLLAGLLAGRDRIGRNRRLARFVPTISSRVPGRVLRQGDIDGVLAP